MKIMQTTVTSGRAYERFISFSDGVTAVAITLLALPLVSIGAPDGDQTVWQLLSQHSGELLSYAITFAVVGVMWRVHARVFQSIGGYDSVLFFLNLVWLALIVALPWPSSIYGAHQTSLHQGGEGLGGAGLFYWGTLAVISGVMAYMSFHAARHPGLKQGEEGADITGSLRGAIFTGFFLVIGIVSVFAPVVAEYLPLGLIVIMPVVRRLLPAGY